MYVAVHAGSVKSRRIYSKLRARSYLDGEQLEEGGNFKFYSALVLLELFPKAVLLQASKHILSVLSVMEKLKHARN